MSNKKGNNYSLIPNITKGGFAVPLGDNLSLIVGNKPNKVDDVQIGKNIMVNNGEIVKTNKKSIKIASAEPIINGVSPSELILSGANFDKTYNKQEKIKDKKGIKNENSIDRATKVYNNYHDAVDFDLSDFNYKARKFFNRGLSNCTLTATQWIDPNNPIKSAKYIIDNPDSGYTKIEKENAKIGDLIIGFNPLAGTYHSMLIENFDKNGEPIVRYSKGTDKADSLVTNMPIGEYHRKDNKQGGHHDVELYYTYNKYGGQTPIQNINKVMNLTNIQNPLVGYADKDKKQLNISFPSTGKQTFKFGGKHKFLSGGAAMGIDIGANLINSLTQGIVGSVIGRRTEDMYKNLKRESTYVPIARNHIQTKVNIEPQLGVVDNSLQRTNRYIDTNTNSSKVALNRRLAATQEADKQKQILYADKENRETALRNEDTKLQARYNEIDNQNKIADMKAESDFQLQRTLGATNARHSITQGWANSISSLFKNAGRSVKDFVNMDYDLATSRNTDIAKVAQARLGFLGHDDRKTSKQKLGDKYRIGDRTIGDETIYNIWTGRVRPV